MRALALAALSAGLAASTAHAFVVVPEIAALDASLLDALPFEAPQGASARAVSLACPGCPLTWRHHGMAHTTTAAPSHLELAFAVDRRPEPDRPDRLLLNDFELYPDADPWHGVLAAPQVLDWLEAATKHPRKGGRRHRPQPAQLGYSLAIHPVAREDAAADGAGAEAGPRPQLELVDVELQVIEIGETFVDGIPAVRVRLVKTPQGKLLIADVEVIEAPAPSATSPAAGAGSDGDAAAAVPVGEDGRPCETLMCRWRAFVRAHLARVKGMRKNCGAHRTQQHHGAPQQAGADADDVRIVHAHYHSWRQLFKNITSYILLPVLIGIVAGVSLSIIGMAVGTLAVFLWRLVVRRQTPWMRHRCRRRGHSCHKASRGEPVVAVEEKSGLVAHQEPPPEYEPAAAAAPEERDAFDDQV